VSLCGFLGPSPQVSYNAAIDACAREGRWVPPKGWHFPRVAGNASRPSPLLFHRHVRDATHGANLCVLSRARARVCVCVCASVFSPLAYATLIGRPMKRRLSVKGVYAYVHACDARARARGCGGCQSQVEAWPAVFLILSLFLLCGVDPCPTRQSHVS